MFCVRQSSVRGCRFSFEFVYFVIKCVECSPVPASFFPYISTALQMSFNVFVSSHRDTASQYGEGRNISVTRLRYSANHNAPDSWPIRARLTSQNAFQKDGA